MSMNGIMERKGVPNYDPNMNIIDLPGQIMMKMAELMDPHSHWRRFAEETNKKFPIGINELEKIALANHRPNGSPTEQLVGKLSSLDMRVRDLVDCLDSLKMEPILVLLKGHEPIKIIEQPKLEVTVKECEELELVVKAEGFPYPRYQWYRLGVKELEEIPGAIENCLRIPNVSLGHAGIYCCRLHNTPESASVKMTDHIKVKVEKITITTSEASAYAKHSPLPVITKHPISLSVQVGQSFLLSCQADGDPPITFKWFQNEKILPKFSGPTIRIENAQEMHHGEYQCLAINDRGRDKSHKAFIQIQIPTRKLPPQHPVKFPDSVLEIMANPQSCAVDVGGSALFKCEARCCYGAQANYEWFHNGKPRQSPNTECLEVHNVDSDDQGSYSCIVSVMINGQRIIRPSSTALLTINVPPGRLPPENHPSDKVALLIGIDDYINETPLTAPKSDIQVMSEIFRVLDFKVVSLLNLTKAEILSAVEVFCQLLGPKVYGVFYFCGHGFEEGGNCYLVPQDPPAGYVVSDCVWAEEVQAKMRNTNAGLICLILDICRTPNKIPTTTQPKIISSQQTGKTIVLYATSNNQNAFEETRRYGLLVHYLQPILSQSKPIEEIFQEFRARFARSHPKVEQIPEVRSNLRNIHISLADKISYKGQTEAFHERTMKWKSAHERPPTMEVKIANLGVVVRLDFQSEYSNVLQVFVTVRDPGFTRQSVAYISGWPSTVSCIEPIQMLPCLPTRTKITLQDIQKLRSDLCVTVVVKYTTKENPIQQIAYSEKVNLGRPLVAVLDLGHTHTNVSSHVKEPQQHGEEYSSLESECS